MVEGAQRLLIRDVKIVNCGSTRVDVMVSSVCWQNLEELSVIIFMNWVGFCVILVAHLEDSLRRSST